MRKIASAALLAAMALLAAISFDSLRSIRRLGEESRKLAQAREVMAAADGLKDLFERAEGGRAAYALSGDDAFLQKYRKAAEEAGPRLAELRKLSARNPRQLHRLSTLEWLAAAKLAALDKSVELHRKGGRGDAAAQAKLTREGRALSEDLARTLTELSNEEREGLPETEAALNKAAHQSKTTGLLAALIAFGLAALSLALLSRKGRRAVKG